MNYKISDIKGWKGSASDRYITSNEKFSQIARRNIELVKYLRKPTFTFSQFKLYDKYGLELFFKKQRIHSVEFGKWLTNVERLVYSLVCVLAFEDLQKITGFRNGVGFDVLKISFGSRGVKNSKAHFNSVFFHININRHKRKQKGYFRTTNEVNINYLESSGLSAIAHEYGHFIDYFAARFIVKSNFASLSRGKKAEYYFDENELNDKNSIVSNFNKLMCLLCFETLEQKKFTPYFDALVQRLEKAKENENVQAISYYIYLLRPVEIFARFFETFCFYELQNKGITNLCLTKPKSELTEFMYPDKKLVQKVRPYLMNILKELAIYNNNTNIKFEL